jgi:hypothetical protein
LEEEDTAVWTLWTPAIAESFAHADIARAVASFEPVDKPAGHAATDWLKNQALNEHPVTQTWLRHEDGRLLGFFAACADEVQLVEKVSDRLPGGGRRPATEIKWICKHRETDLDGRELFLRATAVAKRTWGNKDDAVLVVNPYDEATAAFLRRKYVFWETPGEDRLWAPLIGGG